MLYVFLVDTGTMLTFGMEVALDTVRKLHEVIATSCNISPDKQVLLISGGEQLDSNTRVCNYSAGTDTNPIFLFSKAAIESGNDKGEGGNDKGEGGNDKGEGGYDNGDGGNDNGDGGSDKVEDENALPHLIQFIQEIRSIHGVERKGTMDRTRRLEEEIEDERGKGKRLEDEIKEEKGKLKRLEDEIEDVGGKAKKLVEEIEQERGKTKRVEGELGEERGKVKRLEEEIDQDSEKFKKLEDEIGEERGKTKRLEEEIEEEKDQKKKLEVEVKMQREVHEENLARIEGIKQEIEEYKERMRELEGDVEGKKREVESTRDEGERVRGEVEGRVSEILLEHEAEMERMRGEMEEKLREKERDLEVMRNKEEFNEALISELKEEIEKIRKEEKEEMEEVEKRNQKEKGEIEKRWGEEKEKVREEWEGKMRDVEEERRREVNEMKQRHKVELEAMRARSKLTYMAMSSLVPSTTSQSQLSSSSPRPSSSPRTFSSPLSSSPQTFHRALTSQLEGEEIGAVSEGGDIEQLVNSIKAQYEADKKKCVEEMREEERLRYEKLIEEASNKREGERNEGERGVESSELERCKQLLKEREDLIGALELRVSEATMSQSVVAAESEGRPMSPTPNMGPNLSPPRPAAPISVPSASGPSNPKVSISRCSKDEMVLVYYNLDREQYMVYNISDTLYFLHPDSLTPLNLPTTHPTSKKIEADNVGDTQKMIVAQVLDKEYCQAKRYSNRFKVSVGTRFYRVKVQPWHPPPPGVGGQEGETNTPNTSATQEA